MLVLSSLSFLFSPAPQLLKCFHQHEYWVSPPAMGTFWKDPHRQVQSFVPGHQVENEDKSSPSKPSAVSIKYQSGETSCRGCKASLSPPGITFYQFCESLFSIISLLTQQRNPWLILFVTGVSDDEIFSLQKG